MNTPYRVVLADDVAALRRLVRIGLESSGRFRVVGEASTGAMAVDMVRREKPDLVLLDLSMPEMDGLEALPRILEASPETRVAVFSGFNHVRMAPVALRLGASAYIEKGLEPNVLVQRLTDLLEGGSGPGGTGSGADGGGDTAARDSGAVSTPAQSPILLVTRDPDLAHRLAPLVGQPLTCIDEPARTASTLAAQHCPIVLFDDASFPHDAQDALIHVLGAAGRVPVIQFVPAADSPQAQAGFKLGVEDCIVRQPLDAEAIRRSIRYAAERRRGQEALQASREQAREIRRLKELEGMKTRFYNAAAHEINTPLTPIQLQLHLLRSAEAELKPEHAKSLHILERNVQRLGRLTQGLLDVARLQTGRVRLDLAASDLSRIVVEVVDTFDVVAKHAGVRLESHLASGVRLRMDAGRVAQVLYNLVSNAVKYTPPGGRVLVETEVGRGEVTVRVTDTGLGFTPEQQAHLFEPFSRLHEESTKAGGTGLGLYICKGLVELHGGRIWATSDGPGAGATFAFTLPLAGPEGAPQAASTTSATVHTLPTEAAHDEVHVEAG